MKNKNIVSLLLPFFLISLTASAKPPSDPTLWRLRDAAGLPPQLIFGVEQRARYEMLDGRFRRNRAGSDQVIALRTLVELGVAYRRFELKGEFIDSRVFLEDRGTPLNNSLVDEADILQLYGGWQGKDFFGSGLDAEFKLGRQTLDLGSRRLIARNRYRNTINTFSGLYFNLGETDRWQLHTFAFMPVARRPSAASDILDGVHRLDIEQYKSFFLGAFYENRQLPWGLSGELYLFYLHENDQSEVNTANRRFFTPGLRLYRQPARGDWDVELESVYQVGTSRLKTGADETGDLDHFAFFQHAALGYTFNLPWSPRFVLQYDYASGDRDPDDKDNERFDTLFGARRFEFGPTSLYGAFARSNLSSPGYRLIVKPRANLSAFIAHRLFWLAESKDAWTTSGLQDKTGDSGRFLGNQVEARLRWQPLPENFALEAGWAHLFKGEFAQKAPDAPDDEDTDYFYVQSTLQF